MKQQTPETLTPFDGEKFLKAKARLEGQREIDDALAREEIRRGLSDIADLDNGHGLLTAGSVAVGALTGEATGEALFDKIRTIEVADESTGAKAIDVRKL